MANFHSLQFSTHSVSVPSLFCTGHKLEINTIVIPDVRLTNAGCEIIETASQLRGERL
jgi:hypothetical protein